MSDKQAAIMTAEQIAAHVGGQLIGDPSVRVSSIKPLESAGPGDISFFAPKNPKTASALRELALKTTASALFVSAPLEGSTVTQIVVPHPYVAAAKLAGAYRPDDSPPAGVHPTAVVGKNVTLGAGVSIGAYAVIADDVAIGEGTVIHPHVVIYTRVTIGKGCILHANAVVREDTVIGDDCQFQPGIVVGGEGFGYLPNFRTGHTRIPHVGRVVIENGVDLGANATIDRATFGETKVMEGAKLDNLVTIGHNTVVGKYSFLCGQVGISGSVTIGNRVTLGGQTGVADHVVIGDEARSGGQTGITSDIPPKTDVIGYPARPAGRFRREHIAVSRLPEILRDLKKHGIGVAPATESDSEKEE